MIIGSKVSVLQENETWQSPTVINKCTELHSYIVKLYSNRKLIRCNRKHLQELYWLQRQITFNIPGKGMRDRIIYLHLRRVLVTQKILTSDIWQQNLYSPYNYKYSLTKYKNCIDHRDGWILINQEKGWKTESSTTISAEHWLHRKWWQPIYYSKTCIQSIQLQK